MIADCFINPVTDQTVCYICLDTGHYREKMDVILREQWLLYMHVLEMCVEIQDFTDKIQIIRITRQL